MAGVNTAGVVDNVTPAETIKSGWTKYNAHWHEYDAVLLTNSASGSTAVGDVLALSTAGDSAAVLGDTQSSLQQYVVAEAVIANAATGEFARSGIVSAKAQGSIARGQYVRKSATARAVEDSGTAVGATTAPPSGALGIALAAAAGGLVTCLWFGATYGSSLESGTWSDVSGSRALDTIYQNTGGKKRRVIVTVDLESGASDTAVIYTGSASPPTLVTTQAKIYGAGNSYVPISFEVPNNWYYKAAIDTGTPTKIGWVELDE